MHVIKRNAQFDWTGAGLITFECANQNRISYFRFLLVDPLYHAVISIDRKSIRNDSFLGQIKLPKNLGLVCTGILSAFLVCFWNYVDSIVKEQVNFKITMNTLTFAWPSC